MSQSSKLWHCDIWKCHKMSQNVTLFQIFGTKLLLPFMFVSGSERLWESQKIFTIRRADLSPRWILVLRFEFFLHDDDTAYGEDVQGRRWNHGAIRGWSLVNVKGLYAINRIRRSQISVTLCDLMWLMTALCRYDGVIESEVIDEDRFIVCWWDVGMYRMSSAPALS